MRGYAPDVCAPTGAVTKKPPAGAGGLVAPLGAGVRIALGNARGDPGIYLLLNPADPSGAKPYPFGELTGCLQAGNVCRAVDDLLSHLPLR